MGVVKEFKNPLDSLCPIDICPTKNTVKKITADVVSIPVTQPLPNISTVVTR